ncbi:unnamed protein product [Spodoptera littoralis]|uniref:Uncharacterized protein n=1 Tax=Spodoptera littoralis TaxID=7109 RepID=A0A9P0I104_SPOLI|nr:unnamed protein product [Spodoptera littoralis]CAH1637516.1 unnamed protein product [Spodoptera littoralis]
MKTYQLTGSGLISIGQGCLLKTNEITIYPSKIHSSEIKILPDLPAPTIAPINDIIKITLPQWSAGNQNNNSQTKLYQDTEQFGDRIQLLMQEEDQTPTASEEISYHDIHHYVMIYVMFAIVAISGVIYALRRVRCRWQVPLAAARAETSTTPPLPSTRRSTMPGTRPQTERIEMD